MSDIAADFTLGIPAFSVALAKRVQHIDDSRKVRRRRFITLLFVHREWTIVRQRPLHLFEGFPGLLGVHQIILHRVVEHFRPVMKVRV